MTIAYEFALNEKTRKLLRTEEIFLKFYAQRKSLSSYHESSCFSTLFTIMTCASKTDLKLEIIQELNKYLNQLHLLKRTKKNIVKITEMQKILKKLSRLSIPHGLTFGPNKFLQEIKASESGPYGILSCDIPRLKYWSTLTTNADKKVFFSKLIEPYEIIFHGTNLLLNALRKSVTYTSKITENGTSQIILDSQKRHDIAVLTTGQKNKFTPHIAANQFALSITFTEQKEYSRILKPVKYRLGLGVL
ncbi:MAG: cell division protein ZapD [Methylophilaceae bacterium]